MSIFNKVLKPKLVAVIPVNGLGISSFKGLEPGKQAYCGTLLRTTEEQVYPDSPKVKVDYLSNCGIIHACPRSMFARMVELKPEEMKLIDDFNLTSSQIKQLAQEQMHSAVANLNRTFK